MDNPLGSIDHWSLLHCFRHRNSEGSALAVRHRNLWSTFRTLAKVALGLFGLIVSSTGLACLCPKPEFSASAVENAPIVVGGTVTAARVEDSRLFVEVRTSIVWKGPAQARYLFTADLRSNCSTSHITVGGYYVFFTGESHELSHCSYTYQPGEDMSEEETLRRHDILYSLPHVRMDA